MLCKRGKASFSLLIQQQGSRTGEVLQVPPDEHPPIHPLRFPLEFPRLAMTNTRPHGVIDFSPLGRHQRTQLGDGPGDARVRQRLDDRPDAFVGVHAAAPLTESSSWQQSMRRP